jgi:HTH-type transcriptional regulator/antitoxin HigA
VTHTLKTKHEHIFSFREEIKIILYISYMETLKYKVIATEKQYFKYCDILWDIVNKKGKTKNDRDEISLLTLLIETYDRQKNPLPELDPVQFLKLLMKDHKLKAIDIAKLLNVSEGLVSDMLKYKKGFSKESIRILADRFKMRQEAFNKPYELKTKKAA